MSGEHVLAARLVQPVRAADHQPRRPPDDRVRRVLQVDDPRRRPTSSTGWSRSAGSRANRTVAPLLVDGQDLGAARVAVGDELPPQLVAVGRADQQHPVDPVADVVGAAERRLGAERAEALAEEQQLGPLARAAASTTRRTPRRTGRARPPGRVPGRPGTRSSSAGTSTACATRAVSPLYMYSSGSTAVSSTQPVPVVVTTHSTLRSNAPVRCSSAHRERGPLPRRSAPSPGRRRPGSAASRRCRRSAPARRRRAAGDEVAALLAQRRPGDQRARPAGAQRIVRLRRRPGSVSPLTALKELSVTVKNPSMTTPLSTPSASTMTARPAITPGGRARGSTGRGAGRGRGRAVRSSRNRPTSPAPSSSGDQQHDEVAGPRRRVDAHQPVDVPLPAGAQVEEDERSRDRGHARPGSTRPCGRARRQVPGDQLARPATPPARRGRTRWPPRCRRSRPAGGGRAAAATGSATGRRR